MRGVRHMAGMIERQAVLRNDDYPAAIEDAPHDRPFPRRDLIRPVKERVTEMGGRRMMLEDHRLGLGHAPAFGVFLLDFDDRRIFGDRYWKTDRIEDCSVHVAAISRHAAD